MKNFIKSIIPRIFALIGTLFKIVANFFISISFFLHKQFKTDFGKKLIKFESQMKELESIFKKAEEEVKQASTKKPRQKSIIPNDADPKLVNIIKNKNGK
jgi:hypothetical protein